MEAACILYQRKTTVLFKYFIKKGYVNFGFWASTHLKFNEHLVPDGRKVVKYLRYFKLEEINERVLFSILEEACSAKEKGFYTRGIITLPQLYSLKLGCY